MTATLKKQVFKVFSKKYNLTVKADAIRYLEDLYENFDVPEDEILESLELIASAYTRRDVDSTLVEREDLKRIVLGLQISQRSRPVGEGGRENMNFEGEEEEESEGVDPYKHFNVIDAFKMPRWRYSHGLRTFERDRLAPSLISSASDKAAALRGRYDIIRQRILRNDNFISFAPKYEIDMDKAMLTGIKALKGRQGQSFYLFGMLTQIQEGKFHLEDPDAYVELDMSQKTPSGSLLCRRMFTDGCFTIVDGTYTDDEVCKVLAIGFPPPEPREITRSVFGNIDFLGTPRPMQAEATLVGYEKKMEQICFAVISDVWLDQPKTMSSLRSMFEVYSQAYIFPFAFILIGNFVSEPYLYTGHMSSRYRDSFTALGNLIAEFSELAKFAHFVFVPGPNDPWGSGILPRPSIPDYFTAKLRSKVPLAVFTSNPCRYLTQEIVIFREDTVSKMRRNSLWKSTGKPNEKAESDLRNAGAPADVKSRDDGGSVRMVKVEAVVSVIAAEHEETADAVEDNESEDPSTVHLRLVRTILDQGHLCPLPLAVKPIYWAFDHTLRLYPIPHVLVLADKYEQYVVDYQDCHCFNPGSFQTSDFSWRVYYPSRRTSEVCKLPRR